MRGAYAKYEPALLAICAVILAAQILIPPFIGIADNGDFPKIAGPLSLGPKNGPANFIYFVADYVRAPRYLWQSQTWSTELPLAWLSSLVAGAAFDIRWLGALHAVLFLCAFYVLLRSLRALTPWRAILIAVAAMGIFTDVVYVAYFNSFFTDTAALLGLLLATAAAVQIAVKGFHRGSAILFSLAALLFIGSKPQHAIWGFLFAGFVVLAGGKRGIAAAMVLIGASVVTVRLAPPDYSFPPLFTLTFSKLARSGPTPQEVLRELGLREEDAAFVGMHAFMPQVPAYDSEWRRDFLRKINYGVILKWYMRHPLRAIEILNDTLRDETAQMRPSNLSNFRQQDGHPPGARTNQFAVWSSLRSALYERWPYHMLVWYLLVIAGSIRSIFWLENPTQALLGWIALGVAALAIGEFSVSALADAAETYRHLFIFHVCTDISICLAFAAGLNP